MGNHAEGGMNLRVRGFEGTQARIAEIKSRLAQLEQRTTPTPAPVAQPSMGGQIDKRSGAPSRLGAGFTLPMDGNAPLNPMMLGQIAPPQGPEGGDLRTLATQIAEKYGIDPALFQSLVEQESSFNPRAVSSAGAMGLTQLMPKTAQAMGVADPYDPVQSLNGGAKYLSQMLKEFGGDRSLALAAYNAGPGAVKRFGGIPPFSETQDYVRKILGRIGGN